MKYEKPQIELLEYEIADVVTASKGEWDPDLDLDDLQF